MTIKEGFPGIVFLTPEEKIPPVWATMPLMKTDQPDWETLIIGEEWETTKFGRRIVDGAVKISILNQGAQLRLIACGPDRDQVLATVDKHLPTYRERVLRALEQ